MDACNAQKIKPMEMAMYNDSNELHKTQKITKKSRFILFSGVVLAFCGVTALICHTFYSAQKEDIFAAQKERLQLNADATAESIRLWGVGLDSQARRVSDSELYRLFAQDIATVNEQNAAMLNDPNASSILDEDLAFLAEQIPMMRNILLDFMSYNGLYDARLVSPSGKTLLSSLARPAPLQNEQILAVQRSAKSGKTYFASVRSSSTGMILDYATPLLPAVSDGVSDAPVAALLLSMPVTGQLANFISSGSSEQREVQSNILQYDGRTWMLTRPDRTQPIPQNIQLEATAKSIEFAERESFDGTRQVYSLGILVPNMGWMVVEEVSSDIVNAHLNRAFNLTYGAGIFLCLSVLLIFSLVWWIMIGREERSIAAQFKQLYQVIRSQKHLLDSINISLDVGLMMVDISGKLHLVNRAFAMIIGKTEQELNDCNLHDIMPEDVALYIQKSISDVSKINASKAIEITLSLGDEDRLYRATLFPFEDIEAGNINAAVITMQDITEFRKNSEKRNKQQMSTIEALVGTIEGVDPYLAGHSSLMSRLAELLADNMNLEPKDKETVTTAAVLSQIGRIFVPRELLSKTDKLTQEEQAILAKIPEYAYNILSTIEFTNPVPAAVLQMNERLDGSGSPNKLLGDKISLHGRMLGIINTFCAIASPRSFRAGLPTEVALKILRENTSAYDQELVERLAYILASPEGKEALETRLAEVNSVKA